MNVTISAIKLLALGIWLGALIMLGFAVAGPIFRETPSKTLAGAINGVILHRMNLIEWVCGILALAMSLLSLFLYRGSIRFTNYAETAILVVTVVLLFIYSQSITTRMNELRTTIGDFDHPQQTTTYVAAKSEFDTLHHRYTALVSANMLLILGAFALSVVNMRR